MTGMGKRLLSDGNFSNRHLDQTRAAIAEMALGLCQEDSSITAAVMTAKLVDQFSLKPLVLGTLRSVLVYVQPRVFQADGGTTRGFIAEARIAYRGSPVLWQARPGRDLAFPYSGVPAKASVALRAYTPDKDLAPFEREVEGVLVRTREALGAHASKVNELDAAIRQHIDLVVRTI